MNQTQARGLHARRVRESVIAEVLKRRGEHLQQYTSEHDQTHAGGELGEAAAIFATSASAMVRGASAAELATLHDGFSELTWPFSNSSGDEEPVPLKETDRENYIEAIAVLLAEVERIDLLPHYQKWRQ